MTLQDIIHHCGINLPEDKRFKYPPIGDGKNFCADMQEYVRQTGAEILISQGYNTAVVDSVPLAAVREALEQAASKWYSSRPSPEDILHNSIQGFLHSKAGYHVYRHPGQSYRDEVLRRVTKYCTDLGYTGEHVDQVDLDDVFFRVQEDYMAHIRANLHQR